MMLFFRYLVVTQTHTTATTGKSNLSPFQYKKELKCISLLFQVQIRAQQRQRMLREHIIYSSD
jgi:hypothetical protein